MPADTVTPARTPHIASRLPNVGTTIFTIMSALAQETRAVNLGQGFPDFDCDPALPALRPDEQQNHKLATSFANNETARG